MPLARKRQASDPDSAPDATASRQRRHEEPDSADADMSDDDDNNNNNTNASPQNVMVQKLVRLALSSEYARLPIRRADISAKVLLEQGARQFKPVFAGAQHELRSKFGMEMTELPTREKVTVSQRRAAQKTEKPSSTSKSWILTSTLSHAYRTPDILTPTRAPSTTTESAYTALYSFIIAVISLNGGALSEQKLERYLARTNADTYTPIDRTDRFLQRLCKEGYLVRTKEHDGGEEVVEYMVGPRGKVEVGSGGVAGLVREVYGRGGGGVEDLTPAEREERQEFETKLKRSLGVSGAQDQARSLEEERAANGRVEGASAGPRRSSRRAPAGGDPNEEDEDEEEEEDSD